MACYFKIFRLLLRCLLVFCFVVFFLVIYYLVGACKGLRRGSYQLFRLGRLDLRSHLVLLLSFYGCCLFLLVLCLRVRLGRLLVLVGRIVLRVYAVLFSLRCILLVLLVFLQSSSMYSSSFRILVVGVFRWILLFVGFCFGLVCCRLACGLPSVWFSSIIWKSSLTRC